AGDDAATEADTTRATMNGSDAPGVTPVVEVAVAAESTVVSVVPAAPPAGESGTVSATDEAGYVPMSEWLDDFDRR
ncbi:MAG: hypothetical protein WCJ67_03770, partial [Thermoleophilia bacterium]